MITLKAGAGSCTLPANAFQPGTYALTAAYVGSTYIMKSQSPKRTLTVSK